MQLCKIESNMHKDTQKQKICKIWNNAKKMQNKLQKVQRVQICKKNAKICTNCKKYAKNLQKSKI